jgi:hypothetical protein
MRTTPGKWKRNPDESKAAAGLIFGAAQRVLTFELSG